MKHENMLLIIQEHLLKNERKTMAIEIGTPSYLIKYWYFYCISVGNIIDTYSL